MNFSIHRYTDLEVTPWKNGGGATREIFRRPAHANLENFQLRCSIAEVHSSGPFSLFSRHHRTIIQISGPPMRLKTADFARDQVLSQFEPFAFDGGDRIHAEVSGQTTDYNFMIEKSWADVTCHPYSSLDGCAVSVTLSPKNILVYFVLSGSAQVDFAETVSSGILGALDLILIENTLQTNLPFTLRLYGQSKVIGHTVVPK